ncbi:hypothetical protein [Bradyrhizobium sp. CCBAU 11361]|uniref:hypothetical protein n=1 Tax=Bradyrhizobium sp. CCBAU 11361 TaxID=1630812 RepID=UPI00230446A1|nr:hypothetical protein [Bradyrhizobium sp. CCBAU 11361]
MLLLLVAICCAPVRSQQQGAPAIAAGPASQNQAAEQPRGDQAAQKPGTPASATAQGAAIPSDPQKQCVKPNEFAVELRSGRNPVGASIVLATNFLPTNQRVDVGVRAPYEEGVRYFAGIDYGDETYLFKRQDAVTHRATESDPLVQKHLLEPDQTIVTLNMGDDLAWFGAGSICISTPATARLANRRGGSPP